MRDITLYTASCRGNAKNTYYGVKTVISSIDELRKACAYDHVCAEYKDFSRSKDNFINADCVMFDCDNNHSDEPAEWVTPETIKVALPGTGFYVCYSLNHNKPKNGKSPRPKFHVYFMINSISDEQEYSELKKSIINEYPELHFDTGAKDTARFFYGVSDPQVKLFDGDLFIKNESWELSKDIPEGQRNNTLSLFAGKVLIRYKDTPKAYKLFQNEAEKCIPPLDEVELTTIYNSAKKLMKKVEAQDDYIPPEIFNSEMKLKPGDYSDVGQAEILAREYGEKLRYSPATDYVCYDGVFWEESKPKSHAVAQELTDRQLEEAETAIEKALLQLEKNDGANVLANNSLKKAITTFNKEQLTSYNYLKAAQAYKVFAIKRRDSSNIISALVEAQPKLLITTNDFDAGCFLLNTPIGTYDLRLGLNGLQSHNYSDFITKVTSVVPGNKGADEWKSAIDLFFENNKELVDYVQLIVGLAAIGKVYVEALIIAYGTGRNGKSTFWNTISRVLGTYSSNLSADILTTSSRRNVKPELAEAKGKRLLIAAELEEGNRLSTSNIKQLASTDEITAEKKFKSPFSYTPTHTLVLYTNHLPKVGARDIGTWRRLIVIPFNAKIESSSDIKNYADYLYNTSGEAVLSWIIEGAEKVIAKNYIIKPPECVKDAVEAYREANDWFQHFLDECCEVDKKYKEKSGDLYSTYRAYAINIGDYARSSSDFYTAVENAGFTRRRAKSGRFIEGLKLIENNYSF